MHSQTIVCKIFFSYFHQHSMYKSQALGLTKTDLGLAILLTISPKTIEKDTTRVRTLGILADGLAY